MINNLNIRKYVAAGCVLVFVFALMSGCASKTGKDAGVSNSGMATPNNSFPIVKDKITLKAFVSVNQYVQDINTNDFTKWYEDKTNVHIEWNVVTPAAVKEKLNITLASGDYPDFFMNAKFSMIEQMGYGEQGILIPLNPLFEKYGASIGKAFEEQPWAKEQVTTLNKNIYALPNIDQAYQARMSKKMWLYTPWLDTLKIKEPQTTDDFYNMLKGFKTLGNDVIPLSGANDANNSILPFIMNSFIYTDDKNYLVSENGKIRFVANTPEFKNGLKYLKKLCDEKLLDPLSFTQDRKALTRLAENKDKNLVGAVPASAYIHFTTDLAASGRYKEFNTIPPLRGPEGIRYTVDRGYVAGQGVFAISSKCKNPDVAMRWADWFYSRSQESMSPTMGKEGVGWVKAKEGEKGADGRPGTIKRLIPFGTITNEHWSQAAFGYQTLEDRLSQVVDNPSENIEARLTAETKKNYEPYSNLKMTVPDMFFTTENASIVNNLSKTIIDYINRSAAKFILGQEDIDAGWDGYIRELNKIGVDQYVKIYQQTYDANKK